MKQIYFGSARLPELLKAAAGDGSVSVTLDNERTAVLDGRNPRSATWAKIIDLLQHDNRPVYAEIDADSRIITQLCVPFPSMVMDVVPAGDSMVQVALTGSDAWHYIDRERPGFDELLALLQDAQENGTTIMITATSPRYRIVDARPLLASAHKLQEGPVIVPTDDLSPVHIEAAVDIFNKMSGLSCVPGSMDTPYIPFKYAGSACWVRAHAMCFMMIAEGMDPGKAWITGGSLNAFSPNVPGCIVSWTWHVAPILVVKQEDGSLVTMVLDPSLCLGPVPVAEWRSVMGNDPKNVIYFTTPKPYKFPPHGESDPDETEKELKEYRLLLQGMWDDEGEPPYECDAC